MKIFIFLFIAIIFSHAQCVAQTEFELDPSQSMIMTGKGIGQDATINPYYGEDCYAIVKNIGQATFSIRVQKQGEIIEQISISKGELKKVQLLKGYELYLDPNETEIAKAEVTYQKSIE